MATIIVAVAGKNREIGRDQKEIYYNITEELKLFQLRGIAPDLERQNSVKKGKCTKNSRAASSTRKATASSNIN